MSISLASLATLTLASLGCTYPERGMPLERLEADLGLTAPNEAFDTPEMRLGTMPFNAWYSPLIPLGPDDLGDHAYVAAGLSLSRINETSRGTLYATRAGFLDIAHTRNAIDLTRFVYEHVYDGLKTGHYNLKLLAAEPDLYHLTLTPPPAWTGFDEDHVPAEIDQHLREASSEIAGRIAYLMTTWHEVATFFGYKGMGLVTERPSAFSFDDAASHRVGVIVGMRALRGTDSTQAFDEHATRELKKYLVELGAVAADEVVERSKSVEGRFWDGDQPAFRVVDLGLDGVPLQAYVTDDEEPMIWDWPEDFQIDGYPISALFSVQVELNLMEADKILAAIGNKQDSMVDPRADFPQLHQYIEASMEEQQIKVAADAR